jgi:hypothetical protein
MTSSGTTEVVTNPATAAQPQATYTKTQTTITATITRDAIEPHVALEILGAPINGQPNVIRRQYLAAPGATANPFLVTITGLNPGTTYPCRVTSAATAAELPNI